ncbi:uncharacterized protein EDB93DRAFT_1171528 [Suillus bovinus]|uniref:uncharacterized protein n=1 Tax=Suillus bovinus TaxID=48563 RepID=UPI001B877506|nr:uncharacterized protein EDB93DRAFT_1171528 [Suillus bovinus]KAG2135226.1 hypothetical protein EDB93DRAFT_1171528 [Suillus bovinus]
MELRAHCQACTLVTLILLIVRCRRRHLRGRYMGLGSAISEHALTLHAKYLYHFSHTGNAIHPFYSASFLSKIILRARRNGI